VPVANRRVPRASRSALTSDGAAARGKCLVAHRGKPGWHSRAVFEAPALVAGFDNFAMMGQAVEQRGCHLGVAKHTGPTAAEMAEARRLPRRQRDRSAVLPGFPRA